MDDTNWIKRIHYPLCGSGLGLGRPPCPPSIEDSVDPERQPSTMTMTSTMKSLNRLAPDRTLFRLGRTANEL